MAKSHFSTRGKIVPAVIAAFSLVLALTSCESQGSTSVPGVTDTTITIGSHHNLTGPGSGGNDVGPLASKAYFDYVNDRGGINGRKIIYIDKDTQNNKANTVTAVHQLVEKEKVFAVFDGAGTAAHETVAGYLNSQKVPDLFPDTGCPCWNDPAKLPYTFGWQPDYHREGKILGSYIVKNFPGKRVAYFYQGDDFGKYGVAGLDLAIPASQVVTRQSYQPTFKDVTQQVRAIIAAKADVIAVFANAPYTALLLQNQKELGSKAKVVANYAGADPEALSGLLPDTSLMEGIVTDTALTPVDSTNSWTALLKKVLALYLPGQKVSRDTELGVAYAFSLVQVLKRAGKNLTRESVISAVERGGLSSGFGLTPLRYSTDDHGGYTGDQIAVIRGGRLALQGQPLVTDSAGGPIVAFTGPLAPAPASGIPSP